MKRLSIVLLTGIALFFVEYTQGFPAENWQDIVQPIGFLERLWNADGTPPSQPVITPTPPPVPTVNGVNTICAQWDSNVIPGTTDPFDAGTTITEIQPTQLTHFVRFYNPAAGGSAGGAWIIFPSEVRGLTAVQIRDKFALPTDVTNVVSVDIPPSSTTGATNTGNKKNGLWTGIAKGIFQGPNFYWGHGGGVQTRIMADTNGTNYFPDYVYLLPSSPFRYHPQLIGTIALSYKPLAGVGNTLSVATYLDTFVPEAHSDLETVYFDLDYLNWNNPALNTKQAQYTEAFQDSLNQICPEKYAALPLLEVRNSIIFDTALFDRFLYQHCNQCCDSCGCSTKKCPTAWMYGLGEIGKQKTDEYFTGFKYHSGGALVGMDYQPRSNLMVGGCISGISNSLHWLNEGGRDKSGNLKLGLYTSYFPSCFFIDGILSGGYTWSSTDRTVVFPALDAFGGLERVASAKPRAHDVEVAVQSGYRFESFWCVTPLARLSYFYNKQHRFTESGADSLDLTVQGFSNQTVRLQIGGDMMHTIETSRYSFVPQIRLAWARDFFIDHRTIKASLNAVGNDNNFSITTDNEIGNRFLIGAGLTFKVTDCFNLFAQYDAEVNRHFASQIINGGFNWVF